jgi:CRP-like cAMP-binding protein
MPDLEPLAQLRKFMDAVQPLPELVWDELAPVWQPFEAKRKTILTAPGETEKYLYFVLDGVQRAYALGPHGQEATLVFSYAPSFSGVADSFLLQSPSRYFLETLTQSAFLRAPYAHVYPLMLRHLPFERFVRLAVSHALAGALERQIELQCYTAEEKFRTLLLRSPHVLQLIPHKYLASYLGLDATTFSKLLGSVRL